MAALQSGCHVCGTVMADEDLHRRFHGIGDDDWGAQKKAAGAEADAKLKEDMAKAETPAPSVTKPEPTPPASATTTPGAA